MRQMQVVSTHSAPCACLMLARRYLLWALAAMLALLHSTFAANADADWPRLPTDAEIEQMAKDVGSKCARYAGAPANAVVRTVILKTHNKELLKDEKLLREKGGPLAASALNIQVLVYWMVELKPPGVPSRFAWRTCSSGEIKFQSGRFVTELHVSEAQNMHDFGSPEEHWRGPFANWFKRPYWIGRFSDPGFAPVSPAGPRVSVCPPLPEAPDSTGLIAANDGSRALISYAGTPNKEVLAIADYDVPGIKVQLAHQTDQFGDHSKATFVRADRSNPLRFTTDKTGSAQVLVMLRVYYYPENTYQPPVLQKPGTIRLYFREEGKKEKEVSAELKVGLGLTLETAKMMWVSGAIIGSPPQHAWRTVVKSRFFPKLDMLEYWESLDCDLGLPLPVVNIQSIALNFEVSGKDAEERKHKSPLDDGVGGLEEVVEPGSESRATIGQVFRYGRDPKGNVYLTPDKPDPASQPTYTIGPDVYPAVSQYEKKGYGKGPFDKGYFGFLKIRERDQDVSRSEPSLEPRILDGTPYGFSLDNPEPWYTSALCSTEARDVGQMFFLSAVSVLPVVGDGIDLNLGLVRALCAVSKGEYKDGLMHVGYAVGRFAFGKLVKEHMIPKMTNGNWSPKFYRYLGVDPANMSEHEAKAFADSLRIAYDITVKELEAANWSPPAPDPSSPSAGPRWPSPKQK